MSKSCPTLCRAACLLACLMVTMFVFVEAAPDHAAAAARTVADSTGESANDSADGAVAAIDGPLGAHDFKVAPNPFTPEDPWGLQFSYTLSSAVGRSVGVRVEVFNTTGDKVYASREVLVAKSDSIRPGLHQAAPHAPDRREALGPYLWDGRDDKGVICRNGRYWVHLVVRDGKGSREYLRKVVLVR